MEVFFYIALSLHLGLLVYDSLPLFRKKPVNPGSAQPGFSIVVAAHNEAANLQKLIPLLLNQQYPSFEIIIVLDRSSDDSSSILEQYQCDHLRVMRIQSVPDNWNAKKFALDYGIKAAKYEWLLLTDADCIPASTQWISSFAALISDETELILGLSPYLSEKTQVSQLVNYETLQTALNYSSAALSQQAYMGVGRNLAYRKSSFIKAGGFDPLKSITGGDDDLLVQQMSRSHNTTINLDWEGLTYSVPKRTWKGYFNQKTRHLSVGKHYPLSVKKDHIIRAATHVALWLSFLYLLIFYPHPVRFLGIFGLVIVVKALFFRKIGKKLNFPIHMASFPMMDLIYAIFLPLVSMRAQFVKSIQWKK